MATICGVFGRWNDYRVAWVFLIYFGVTWVFNDFDRIWLLFFFVNSYQVLLSKNDSCLVLSDLDPLIFATGVDKDTELVKFAVFLLAEEADQWLDAEVPVDRPPCEEAKRLNLPVPGVHAQGQ